MSKTINVDKHIDRYKDTELSDIVRLITGLQNLVESRRDEKVKTLKEQLALLERGEIPTPEPTPAPVTRTRGGKKKAGEQVPDLEA